MNGGVLPLDIRLKQRLVGAIVLVALAVIFIPMILQSPEQLQVPDAAIPPRPDAQFTDRLAAPAPQTPVAPAEPARQVMAPPSAAPAAKPAAPTPPPKPASAPATPEIPPAEMSNAEDVVPEKAPPVPALGAWVIQVGVFNQEQNAQALAKRLRDKGYTTFVERFAGKAGPNFRVRIGPLRDRAQADQMLARVKHDENLPAMVKSYP